MNKDKSLNIAILTISDTREKENDKSGKMLRSCIDPSVHNVQDYLICKDDKYQIREIISKWINTENFHVIITTGGTGITGRDGTPEAVIPLFDKKIDGFGELFRYISYDKIKTSALQSRACAGVSNATYIFCLPGSPSACKDAWSSIITFQLSSTHKPCNLVELIDRLK